MIITQVFKFSLIYRFVELTDENADVVEDLKPSVFFFFGKNIFLLNSRNISGLLKLFKGAKTNNVE